MSKITLYNAKGEPIRLTPQERFVAREMQAILNSNPRYRVLRNDLGYNLDITTLSTIEREIVEQKFFTVAPADYFTVRVGQGAWSDQLVTYREFSLGGAFEDGLINTATGLARLADVGTGVDAVRLPVLSWAKQITYALPELMQAAKAGNWDVVQALSRSRKKNWDLGIQQVAFLGLVNNTQAYGLLTQPDVTVNTTLIPVAIKLMSAAQFQAFLAGLLEAYRLNASRTATPTHFVIPEDDYNGLVNSVDEGFPLKSRLERLTESLRMATQNPAFKVLPLAYAIPANSLGMLAKGRYIMYSADPETVRMNIPVDYTTTPQASNNNFQFQNAAYGQFTGVKAYRPAEMIYFDRAAEPA